MVRTKNNLVLKHSLSFSKVGAGEDVDVTLADDCVNIIESFQRYARSRNITLEYDDVDDELKTGYKKRELLEVYFELLSSACAYVTGIRNVSLKVAFEKFSGDTSDVTRRDSQDQSIIVSVTGIGISPDDLSKLFYCFCHSESKRITRAELKSSFSLTKVLIDLNGGSIRIENRKSTDEAGSGANFILILHTGVDCGFEDPALMESDSTVVIETGILNDPNEWPDESASESDKLRARYEQVVNLKRPDGNDHPDDKFLCKLMTLLEYNISDPEFNVSKLVNEIGMSRPVLFRKAKILTGSSIINLIRSRRLKMAEMLLKQNKVPVSEVAFKVGYNDPKYFSKSFRSEYGKTPTEFVHALRS
jgi:AraC-like DNA-binding protein